MAPLTDMTFPAKNQSPQIAPAARYALPLVALWTAAAIYAAVALDACLRPAGPGLINSAGSVLGNDFLTFYAASLLVHAREAAAVFDQSRFYALQDTLSGLRQHFPWSYPPVFLLFVAPLAQFPYLAALAVWIGTASVAFGFVVRRLSGLALPLILIAPPLIQNAVDGQNGALTAVLIAGGILALTQRRAGLAGFLFGVLTYKPQVLVLIPVCLLAAREYRALFALVLTSCSLVIVSIACFGVDIWWTFLNHLPAHAAQVMANARPSNRVPTLFAAIYKLTLSIKIAETVQFVATLGAWALVYWVWRRAADVFARILAISIAMPLATPIMFEYDLAIWTLPAAMLAMHLWRARGRWPDWVALMFLFLLPPLIWATSWIGINVWAFALIAFVPYVIFATRRADGPSLPA